MTEPHRSRTAWPGPMSLAGVEPGHSHELPAPLVQRTRLLTRAVVIFGVCLAAIGTLLVLVIVDRGKARDLENERLQELIRQSTCDLLDTLPEGGLLDRPRAKYGCGPGIPLSELPPEQQERLRNQRSVPAPPSQPVAPAPSSAPTPLVEGANPSGPVLTPEAPPTPPSTSSEPPPLVDLGPYTGPVCESVRVCF